MKKKINFKKKKELKPPTKEISSIIENIKERVDGKDCYLFFNNSTLRIGLNFKFTAFNIFSEDKLNSSVIFNIKQNLPSYYLTQFAKGNKPGYGRYIYISTNPNFIIPPPKSSIEDFVKIYYKDVVITVYETIVPIPVISPDPKTLIVGKDSLINPNAEEIYKGYLNHTNKSKLKYWFYKKEVFVSSCSNKAIPGITKKYKIFKIG